MTTYGPLSLLACAPQPLDAQGFEVIPHRALMKQVLLDLLKRRNEAGNALDLRPISAARLTGRRRAERPQAG